MSAELSPRGGNLPALAGEAASLVGEVHAASLHVQTVRKVAKQLGAGVTPVNRALLAQAERLAALAAAVDAGQAAGQIADPGVNPNVRAADVRIATLLHEYVNGDGSAFVTVYWSSLDPARIVIARAPRAEQMSLWDEVAS
jgi:hypothetical protein